MNLYNSEMCHKKLGGAYYIIQLYNPANFDGLITH